MSSPTSPQLLQRPERRLRLIQALPQGVEAGHAMPTLGTRVLMGESVVAERCDDGTASYRRVCGRHQWVGLDAHAVEYLSVCPFCQVDLEAGRGRDRYRDLVTGAAFR